MKKILIVEDDKSLSLELKELLDNAGYQASILKDFKNAYEEITRDMPDLILMDINIPYFNGEMILQNLRKVSNVPVVMVTSRNTEVDEVISYSYGADDYITKPYNPTILLLRISAILKRVRQADVIFKYHDLEINLQKGIIFKGDIEVILTKNEMIILGYFLNHQDMLVSRDELMTELWNNEEYINDNALTVNISRLRNKLRDVGYPDAIVTRKGLGYILS